MTVLASSSAPGSSYAQAIAQLAYGLLVARLPTIGVSGSLSGAQLGDDHYFMSSRQPIGCGAGVEVEATEQTEGTRR
jgi:hypothetical protein